MNAEILEMRFRIREFAAFLALDERVGAVDFYHAFAGDPGCGM